jgi:PhzF family phenazine biosynthesis protein
MSDVPRRFQQVDVFSPRPLHGNPVAVVLDGSGLTTDEMLAFTRWTNLSEATFLLPPASPHADYGVRIFTAAGELPFAGHPTLGSCHAWLAVGGQPRDGAVVVQECGAGLVRIRRVDGRLAFEAPPLRRSGPVSADDLERIAEVIRLPVGEFVASQWVDNGPGWVGVLLRSAEAVLAVDPALPPGWSAGTLNIGLAGAYAPDAECAFEVRAIFNDDRGRLIEDPVTGSLNASLGEWLIGSGLADAPYVASQGTVIGREGRVHVSTDAQGAVWVAGDTHTVVDGAAVIGEAS